MEFFQKKKVAYKQTAPVYTGFAIQMPIEQIPTNIANTPHTSQWSSISHSPHSPPARPAHPVRDQHVPANQPKSPAARFILSTFSSTFNLSANPLESILTQPFPQPWPLPETPRTSHLRSCTNHLLLTPVSPLLMPRARLPWAQASPRLSPVLQPYHKQRASESQPSTERVPSSIPCSELRDLLCFLVYCPSSTPAGSSRTAGPQHL